MDLVSSYKIIILILIIAAKADLLQSISVNFNSPGGPIVNGGGFMYPWMYLIIGPYLKGHGVTGNIRLELQWNEHLPLGQCL